MNELLDRMCDDSPSTGGPSVSFGAHRDAEKLEGAAYIQVAAALLENEKRAERKRHLYFILGHLGAKSNALDVEAIVRPALSSEKNGYTLVAALNALRRLPVLKDASDVRPLLRSKNGQVREAAILALGGDRSAAAERDLIALIKRTKNPFELTYALQTLGAIGGSATVPVLASFIHHRTVDVKVAAIGALAHVGGKEQQDALLDALGDRNPAAKIVAVFALAKYGDARAVPKVAARVIAILRKGRTVPVVPSDLIAGLEFLRRHRSLPEARDAIEEAKRSTSVFPEEARWIEEHLSATRSTSSLASSSERPRKRSK
jgi:hypothetical protein